ncbi:MAG: YajQ family cyclic di-GMP-binding protein [Xanthomonadales bacterium]|nr:YajQ family cyclic di-GMP-binding protein [Xanthomonadales bacterium]
MPSFDVVSEVDDHELTNAVDQANRELDKRFDFRGSNAKFELEEKAVSLRAQNEFQLQQMLDILRQRMTARKIDIRCLDVGDPESNVAEARQRISVKQGIEQADAKKIQGLIRDSKIKVQAQINGDKLRVTGKKRDDLQACMAMLRGAELALPLQFDNFRD